MASQQRTAYSITSSASASKVGGISKPIVLAARIACSQNRFCQMLFCWVSQRLDPTYRRCPHNRERSWTILDERD